MPDSSTQSIQIDAEPAQIMSVIADFDHYPEWTGSVKRARVVATGTDGRPERVSFLLDAGLMRDEYELSYVWSGDRRVDWNLVQGQLMKSQQGSYTLVPQGQATEVTYALSVELTIPMLGLLKRKAERIVMDTALNALKKRVESQFG